MRQAGVLISISQLIPQIGATCRNAHVVHPRTCVIPACNSAFAPEIGGGRFYCLRSPSTIVAMLKASSYRFSSRWTLCCVAARFSRVLWPGRAEILSSQTASTPSMRVERCDVAPRLFCYARHNSPALRWTPREPARARPNKPIASPPRPTAGRVRGIPPAPRQYRCTGRYIHRR
jgi:hypothetical protein